jgi:HEAT repeat protein
MRAFVRPFMAGILISVATTLTAQQPEIVHAQLKTQIADHGLKAVLDGLNGQHAAVWVGYSIPVNDRFSSGWGSNQVEYLEGGSHASGTESNDSDKSFNRALILMRVADGAVGNLRVESPEHRLDAGGLELVWITGVKVDDSVRVLKEIVRQDNDRHIRDSAVFAISLHQTDAATSALVSLAGTGNDLELREKAAFWLANERGHEGFVAIQHLARTDDDARFREKLTFDLTLVKDPGALDELIRMAHEDASPEVRKQAQFWMASKGGKKVAEDLRQFAANDPNETVRRSAVFALSQLPGDEAATQLIAVADSSKDPAVRKQAVFWLGQSSDPRALAYLTKLLKQ